MVCQWTAAKGAESPAHPSTQGLIRKTMGRALVMMAVSNLGGMLSELENFTMNALAAGKDPKAMIEDEIRRIQACVAADRAKTISHSILSRAAIPPRFANRRLSNYQPTCPEAVKALQVAQQYADTFQQAMGSGRSLIFIGNVGAGKTHLAVDRK